MFDGPRGAGLAAIFALVSCAGNEAATPVEKPTAEQAYEARIENARPVPKPASERVGTAPASVLPAKFSYSGELTQGGWIRGKAPAGAVSVTLGENTVPIAPDGSFFAAFDRDSGTSAELTATLENGRTVRENLAVSPRKWNIERVNVPRRRGGPSAAYQARRAPELDAIWDARQEQTGANGWQQQFIWPVKGRISGRFGSQRIYRGEPGSYHSGIDIAPGNGVPFVAPADGVVTLARTGFSLEGGLIIIDHGMGLNSAFLHASKLAVKKGDRVSQGQYIGNIGSSGRATGPHLHWSIKWNLARLDPLLFVGPQ